MTSPDPLALAVEKCENTYAVIMERINPARNAVRGLTPRETAQVGALIASYMDDALAALRRARERAEVRYSPIIWQRFGVRRLNHEQTGEYPHGVLVVPLDGGGEE